MEPHLYSKAEAERVLSSFPSDMLSELLKLAERAKTDQSVIKNHERITLPEGWAYVLYGNCVLARYQDGEQERKAFFVPQIYIEFAYTESIEAKKSVLERLPLGYCSCGKVMPLAQKLLWASDMAELKGIRNLHYRVVGYTVGFFIGLWIWLRPIHQYSLMFNRHPSCL